MVPWLVASLVGLKRVRDCSWGLRLGNVLLLVLSNACVIIGGAISFLEFVPVTKKENDNNDVVLPQDIIRKDISLGTSSHFAHAFKKWRIHLANILALAIGCNYILAGPNLVEHGFTRYAVLNTETRKYPVEALVEKPTGKFRKGWNSGVVK
jgi:hypothetical protein